MQVTAHIINEELVLSREVIGSRGDHTVGDSGIPVQDSLLEHPPMTLDKIKEDFRMPKRLLQKANGRPIVASKTVVLTLPKPKSMSGICKEEKASFTTPCTFFRKLYSDDALSFRWFFIFTI